MRGQDAATGTLVESLYEDCPTHVLRDDDDGNECHLSVREEIARRQARAPRATRRRSEGRSEQLEKKREMIKRQMALLQGDGAM